MQLNCEALEGIKGKEVSGYFCLLVINRNQLSIRSFIGFACDVAKCSTLFTATFHFFRGIKIGEEKVAFESV